MTKEKAMIHTLAKENDELKAEIGRLRQALTDKSYELWKESYEEEHLRNIRLEEKIKALEQQPSEEDVQRVVDYLLKPKSKPTSQDCVSRASVKELFQEGCVMGMYDFLGIDDLPPVTPTNRMCKDCTKSKILNGFEGYSIVCSRFGRMAVNPDFYCADFKKRGSENEVN